MGLSVPKDGDREQVRAEILDSLDDLPAFPPVAARVLQLMNDPDASAADLARAISRDQSLTAKILRAGNSSFYGFAQQVTSLPQAVVVLGLRMVRDLVLLDSLPLKKQKGGMSPIERGLWVHAVGVALASRFLALRAGNIDPDAAFLVGLFHDAGHLVLHQLRPGEFEEVWRAGRTGQDWCELELEQFGIDHTEVGAEAFVRWELPRPLSEVARHHHDDASTLDTLGRIVQCADELVDWLELHPELAQREDDEGAVEVNATQEMMTNADAPLLLADDRDPSRPGSAGHFLHLNPEEVRDLLGRLRVAIEREARFFLSSA